MKRKQQSQFKVKEQSKTEQESTREFCFPESLFLDSSSKPAIFRLVILILLFGTTIFIRFFHLSADPPYVSWSQDLLTDPSQYVSFARSKLLWGYWDLFGQHLFLLWKNSALTLFSFLSFAVLGIGRLQANLTAVILNILSLLFLFLALRKTVGYRVAVLSILLLGTDFTFLSYARETFAECSAIFFSSIGFYFLALGSKKTVFLWLAGASYICSILFGKMLAVFILPACLAVLILISIKEPQKRILPILLFLGGALVVFLPWFFLVYNPARGNISAYLNEMSV